MQPSTRPVPSASDHEDGRTARSRRTREAVVDALLALHVEGQLAPTAQQVAERAGVALRTVFGHFSDLETLWAEAGARELAKLRDVADDVPPDLPLAERVERFAASRARVLERLLPVMRAARLREPTSPQLAANRAMFMAAGDEEVRRTFANELAGLDDAAVRRLLVVVHVVAGGSTWEVLRHDRALSAAEAQDVVCSTLHTLLEDAR